MTKKQIICKVIRVIVMALICGFTLYYVFNMFAGMSSGRRNVHPLNYGWELKYRGRVYQGIDLRSFSFGDTRWKDEVRLGCVLPEELPEESMLLVYIHYYDVRVLLDGEEVFEADTESVDSGRRVGSGFYTVNLGSDCSGRNLEIIIRAGEDNAFSSLRSPEIWDASTFWQDFASDNLSNLAISFFFIIVGIAMLIMAFTQEIRGTFSFADTSRFGSLALLAMTFGIWIFTGMHLTELFTSDIVTKVELNYYAFYFIPLCFIGFHFETGRFKDEAGVKQARSRNIVYGITWIAGLLFMLFIIYRYKVCGESLRTYLTIAHIYDSLVVIMLISVKVYDLFKGVNRHLVSSYVTLMTGIAALVDLVRYNIYSKFSPRGSAGFTMSTLYIVMVFFVLSLFFDYMSITVRDAREEERIGIISKLAYTDALTGLNNRQSTEKYFDDIDGSGEEYIVVEFDLNNLKQANDTYGHEEGDRYITLFSETLKHVFEGKGYIARTGGDEFVYVMIPKLESDREWLEGKLKNLNAILANKDTGHSGLRMSTAFGSYDSAVGDAGDIRDGLRQADAKMYEMKKLMKAGR